MPELKGRTELGRGYTLVAPGLRGQARLLDAGAADTRASEQSTSVLDEALARADMNSIATIDITATPIPGTTEAGDLRDANGDDALLLEVPDLGPETGQVVMSVDEAGAITWHFPLDGGEVQPPAVRGAGDKKRFDIRKHAPATPPAGEAGERSLIGALGKKLLKVIVYPVTDALLGKSAEVIAEHWEEANRTYGLRTFTPQNRHDATKTQAERERVALTKADLDKLGTGRALLFVHGTFSTAHGAFQNIPADLMGELHQRYDGRTFAFNHFTLSHDPAKNVGWFLDAVKNLDSSAQLEVDIVCHSRGGLVARVLDHGGPAFGLETDRVKVRRIAFVGVPNAGTLLAQPDHMIDMIDRLTTALNLLPASGVVDVLEGILIAVKIIGHGALKGLKGLQSMNPNGDFLKKLNAGGRADAEYFAVAANYEVKDGGLKSILSRGIDGVVDRVFEKAENDLVVPEQGVYAANGGVSFPIPVERAVRIPAAEGVMHTAMFGHPKVVTALNEWLR